MTSTGTVRHGGWADEVSDLARGAAGGLIIGLPLLYTMEVFWTGVRTTPVRNLVVLAVCFVLLVALHRTAGFRRSRDVRLVDALDDAVVALGLSLVLVTVVLVTLREITMSTPLGVALGKIVYEGLPFALGVGVARFVLTSDREGHDQGGDGDGPNGQNSDGDDTNGGELNATFADLGATVLGALLMGAAIAPTDEIPMLDSQMGPVWVLTLMGLSLVASYGVVFVAGFAGQEKRKSTDGVFQHPLTETIVCYLVSLAVSLGLLWLFHRVEGRLALTHVVVLGLPTSVGAAAGRLAV